MSNSRRGTGYWISAWFPVAVGVAVVAMESTAFLGADRTTGPLRWLAQLVLGPIADARWNTIHHFVRKAGHFLGYGLLGLVWLRAWRMTKWHWPFTAQAMIALTSTALVAGCDEFHQTFLPNRTGSHWDVLLDCSGALVLQWLTFFRARKQPTQVDSFHA